MKIYKNVRGTSENIPDIEVNVDTVYVRTNIRRVEEIDFSGWEYDEIQYVKDNYIEELHRYSVEQGLELSEREINEIMMGMQISNLEIDLLELQLGGN